MTSIRLARWIFGVAGVYGMLVIAPQYFLEAQIGREYPPAITHPEHFYGFLGVTLAWQVLFLVIARDPVRLRPAMPVAVLEKLAFAVAVPILFLQDRVPGVLVVFAGIDALLAVGFVVAWVKTPSRGLATD